MKIKNLKLYNFRNYSNLEIDFDDNLNIIYGSNGSGKSNLIEAIYLLSLTKSFRTSSDINLINYNSDTASIVGNIITYEKTEYKVELNKDGKKVFIDSDKIAKISDYISKINIILFNPLDTKIIFEAPSSRRKMIDISISQINKEYLLLLNNYNKILKNRNAYLKQMYINGNSSLEYLDILTKKLVDYGLKINLIRSDYIQMINDNISFIYKNIFKSGELIIKYNSVYNKKSEEQIFSLYKKNYRKEMELGKTLIGIHHDDIEFFLDNHLIRDYGSVGQQKNSIISFKLSELLIVKKIKKDYPILILDDLFSELDNKKINNILKMLNKEVQTFITTTDVDQIDKKLLNDSVLFNVENSQVERVS